MTDLALALAGEWSDPSFKPARILSIPPAGTVSDELELEALFICEEAGLNLDPWERYSLIQSLRVRENGTWGALEVGLCVPRQNGKNAVLEARELVALFIDAERWPNVAARLTVHSAHEAKTGHEAFERLMDLIDGSKRLRAKVIGRPRYSEGSEMIRIRGGRRIRFRTRVGGGGRGLSGDLLIFDEAMILGEALHRAVWPIVTARPNPQIWYTGSAVDQLDSSHNGLIFSRVRRRGMKLDPDLLYLEWSLPYELPDEVPTEIARDPEQWARSNPGLDIRLARRVIAVEQRALSARGFAVERLGVGDWPDPEGATRAIPEADWDAAKRPDSTIEYPVCFALDVSPERKRSAIAVAGRNAEGQNHVEVVQVFRGVSGLVSAAVEVTKRHHRAELVVDGRGPGAALIPKLEDAHVRVVPATAGDMAKGCGMLYDGIVHTRDLVHLGDPTLDSSLAGAAKRKLGDTWAWSREHSTSDITPLVSGTLALWGFLRKRIAPSEILSPHEYAGDDEDQITDDDLPPLEPEDLR